MKNTFLESVRRADEAVKGLSIRGGDFSEGFRRINGANLAPRAVLETARLVEAMLSGGMSKLELMLRMKEAQGTSDFPYLMGDNMHRRLLAQYATIPVSWPALAYRETVNDFRTSRALTFDGGTSPLDPVAEFAPYPQRIVTEGKYDIAVHKFGDKMGFSWEAWINDDTRALRRAPAQMAQGARTTEEKAITTLYAGNATFFSLANKNTVVVANGASSANPALAPGAISDALTVMASQVNSDGSPILVQAATLVVPTALAETARRILNAQSIWWNDAGGTTNQRLLVNNTLSTSLKLVVAPWLDSINASGHGKTGWYLFADPNVGRPAIQIAFLRGHEQPEMWQKSSDALLVGGGLDSFENGSFENDTIEYKVRHVFGVGLVDPKSAVYSEGDGT